MIYPSSFHKQHRLRQYDYSSANSYLLSFNTKNRERILSFVSQPDKYKPPVVSLLPYGEIAQKYILRIPLVYPGVTVDNYVIMPDHIHLLLTIENIADHKYDISRIIRTTKGKITKEIGDSIWQLDYYDVIADTEEIYRLCHDYIDNNPAVWLESKTEPIVPK